MLVYITVTPRSIIWRPSHINIPHNTFESLHVVTFTSYIMTLNLNMKQQLQQPVYVLVVPAPIIFPEDVTHTSGRRDTHRSFSVSYALLTRTWLPEGYRPMMLCFSSLRSLQTYSTYRDCTDFDLNSWLVARAGKDA